MGSPPPGFSHRTPAREWAGGVQVLVLSRKLGEKIWLGESICITVVDIDRGKIRLGIEAPRDLPIYRGEIRPGAPTRCPACKGSGAAGAGIACETCGGKGVLPAGDDNARKEGG
jgi:carbon storage regulator